MTSRQGRWLPRSSYSLMLTLLNAGNPSTRAQRTWRAPRAFSWMMERIFSNCERVQRRCQLRSPTTLTWAASMLHLRVAGACVCLHSMRHARVRAYGEARGRIGTDWSVVSSTPVRGSRHLLQLVVLRKDHCLAHLGHGLLLCLRRARNLVNRVGESVHIARREACGEKRDARGERKGGESKPHSRQPWRDAAGSPGPT